MYSVTDNNASEVVFAADQFGDKFQDITLVMCRDVYPWYASVVTNPLASVNRFQQAVTRHGDNITVMLHVESLDEEGVNTTALTAVASALNSQLPVYYFGPPFPISELK